MVGYSATLNTLPTSGILKATTGNNLEGNLNDKLEGNDAAKTIR
ncbi:MAG: hypothetical protein ACI936_002561 [Paraglaciecola sp.]|jgi:hypothetical protein